MTTIRTNLFAVLAALITLVPSAFALSGGGAEDNFYATWKDSNEPGGPAYQWVDISSTGTEVLGYGDTARSAIVDLEVSTPIYWYIEDNDQLTVSENGYIQRGNDDDGTDSTNDCLPSQVSNNGGRGSDRLYVLHDDLDFAPPLIAGGDVGRGRILYEYFPRSPHPHHGCGVQVFTWINMRHDGSTDRFEFQALLFDNFVRLWEPRARLGIDHRSQSVGGRPRVLQHFRPRGRLQYGRLDPRQLRSLHPAVHPGGRPGDR